MKKILFVLLALVVSQSAMAEWVDIGEGASGKSYYDPKRIEPYFGGYQSIWGLHDYDITQERKDIKAPYRSEVFRWNVDCQRKEFRAIAGFWYSENMGKGKLVDSESKTGSSESAPPNSVAEALVNLACAKKK
jgi:hypothetical protein